MIQDSVNRISYDGNGIATEFAYPFSITSTQDVKVMLVDADGTETILTSDYYVDEANSKIDYPGYPAGEEPLPELQPSKLATGQRIVLYRELDVTQLTSLFDQYPFKTIEVMIDKTTILLQQMKDAQQRALTLSVSTDTGVSLILPAPSGNKSFRWNAAGTALELTADPATVLASVQGYTDLAQGYATTADEKASIATTGANTATEQANLATEAAETFTLATQAEAEAGIENTKAMTALRTLQALLANIATQAQAEAGTDNTKIMTSLRTLQLLTAKISTPAQAIAGTDNGVAITPLQLRNAFNAGGSAPVYACRAWVNFNGSGTVAIRASGNVSSITDNGTGNYTVNFAIAMPDEKYSVSAINSENSSGTTATRVLSNSSSSGSLTNYTVNGVQLVITSGAGSNYDATLVSVVIFR